MPLEFEYPIGVKKEFVEAMRPFYGNSYPDPEYANKINVTLEWPVERVHYPAIYITFSQGPIRNMGLGHYEIEDNDDGIPVLYKHSRFEGAINFNVVALSPLERDRISAGLINLLMFNEVVPEFKGFKEALTNQDFVYLVPDLEYINPGGESTAPVPWGNEDELLFLQQYTINMYGEFYSNADTGELVRIDEVDVFPYRPDQPVPW